MKTKRLNLTIQCTAVYNSAIQVPDDMSLEETIAYAKTHLQDATHMYVFHGGECIHENY